MRKNYPIKIVLLFSFLFLFISCTKSDEYTPIEDILPIATDDNVSYTYLTNVTINVVGNDTTGDAVVYSTINLVGGSDTDTNGTLDTLVIVAEGTWTTNLTNGTIVFTPLSSFIGNPTPVKYYVKDSQGNNSNQATITIVATSTVNVNLNQVPYPKLSDYGFFAGAIKNQIPSLNLLPYEPASSLFTDYAHKKRFVWMPSGTSATYNGDTNVLELPVGAALVKTFYYDNVQNVTPVGSTRIVETRVMIRKSSGWIFAEYVWNAAQTEAFLDLNGSTTSITWIDEDGITKTVPEYRLPNEVQCIICHKSQVANGPVVTTTYVPIGIKPQNLNFNYNYSNSSSTNQLLKWMEQGYLINNFSLPTPENTTINYSDTSKSIAQRARSYVDINCAHCHKTNSHCDYRPMRFAFNETGTVNGNTNMGVCVETSDLQDFAPALSKVVTPGNINRSMLFHRINTTNEAFRMPLHGRSVIHTEGISLMEQWINSLEDCP